MVIKMFTIKYNGILPLHAQQQIFVENKNRESVTSLRGLSKQLKTMKYGDCLIIECDTKENLYILQKQASSMINAWCKTHGFKYSQKFALRFVENGIGIFDIDISMLIL